MQIRQGMFRHFAECISQYWRWMFAADVATKCGCLSAILWLADVRWPIKRHQRFGWHSNLAAFTYTWYALGYAPEKDTKRGSRYDKYRPLLRKSRALTDTVVFTPCRRLKWLSFVYVYVMRLLNRCCHIVYNVVCTEEGMENVLGNARHKSARTFQWRHSHTACQRDVNARQVPI